jgi:predicted metal-binding membrane protein
MLGLFALGVMSLTWMGAIAVVIFVQKVLPLGDRLAPLVATTLAALATWVVVSA